MPESEEILKLINDSSNRILVLTIISNVIIIVSLILGFIAWLISKRSDKKFHLILEESSQLARDQRLKEYKESQNKTCQNLVSEIEKQSNLQLQTGQNLQNVLTKQSDSIQKLVDMQNNIISVPESIRIIEDYYLNVIMPEFCRICDSSIQLNDYLNRKKFVESKIRQSLQSIINNTIKTLNERYTLSIKSSLFFPVESENYSIVIDIWKLLEEVHLTKSDDGIVESDSLILSIKKCCLDHFVDGSRKALDIYSED